MSLKLAAIIPHPPLLIPSIGKENLLRLDKTRNSYSKLEQALAAEKIETIIIISSHGPIKQDAWLINIAPEYEINFEEFGDFSTKLKIGGDLELAQNIRESLIDNSQMQAIYQPVLDHGCGVPLYSLLANQKNIEIVPLHISGASLAEHFDLGKNINAQIEKGRKKIAVLASSDLSHSLEKKSPGGFSPRAARFDQKILELLQNKSINEFLNLDENLIAETKPCGLPAIAMLLGILSNTGYDIAATDYEYPFGVGYLSMILKPLPK
jgi:aromatic ring-opening dioxygenase LigB subunit